MGFNFFAEAAAIATVFAFVASSAFWWVQRRSMMLSRTYDLFRFYYGAEHYASLHAPSQGVIYKWYNLPDGERQKYRKEVVSFWSRFESNEEGLLRFTDEAERGGDHLAHFYKAVHRDEGLTEAQAIDCVVHFWSGLYELIQEKMIDPKSAKRLFRVPYSWRRQFFRDLGRDVRAQGGVEPDWIKNTESLEKFFDS